MSVLLRILVIGLALTSIAAQEKPHFSSASDLVVVHATVKDRHGAYVDGLTGDAFQILEDDVPQQLAFLDGVESPATVGFLIDSSGSMREGRERVIAAATTFASSSQGRDEMFAIAFNEHVRFALPPLMPFTSNPTIFRMAIARVLNAEGLTAMYDAVTAGLSYVARGRHPRRALVVVGDGGDNASKTTFEHMLRHAQTSNAAIYTVGIIDALEREAKPGLLKRLAQATGGEAFFPRRVEDIDAVFRQISEDIRHSYTLGYVSSNSARDGQFRRLEVRAIDGAGRRLRVRARDGYRAGGSYAAK